MPVRERAGERGVGEGRAGRVVISVRAAMCGAGLALSAASALAGGAATDARDATPVVFVGAGGDEVLRPIAGRFATVDAAGAVVPLAAGAVPAAAGFVSEVFETPDGGEAVPTPRLFVAFAEGVGEAEAAAVLAGFGLVSEETAWRGLRGVHRVERAAGTGRAVLDMAAALSQHPAVRFAEPDMFVTIRPQTLPPDDESFGLQWALDNPGGVDVGALAAWEHTLGDPDVRTVIIDVGVQPDHPDLNLAGGFDFTSEAGPLGSPFGAPVNMCDRHGTWVAGGLAGRINNALGVVGLAPGSPAASARIGISQPACDLSFAGQISWTADAVVWAGEIGALVTNNSNAYSLTSSLVREAYESTRAAGVIHFSSAGNGASTDITYPANLGAVHAVGAINIDGERAFFSNFGGGLELSAPGQDIYTTDRTGPDGKSPGDFAFVDGTSFASPLAAGAAVLARSVNRGLTALDTYDVLRLSATDLGAAGRDADFGNGVVNAAAAVELGACWTSWAAVPGPGPTRRSNHGMAHDTARGATVLFGGLDTVFARGDTWEFTDAAGWSQRPASTAGLSARYGHAMAYDAARGRTVMFGGFVGAAPVAETWTWDGLSWTRVQTTGGPSARLLASAAYDAARGVVVLFGGRLADGTSSGETWTWNGSAWTLASTTGPSPRNYHAMAYDAASGSVVLHGGTAGAAETWAWDGSAWELRSTAGPSRSGHVLVFDDRRGELLMFAGRDEPGTTQSRGLYAWRGDAWEIVSLQDAGPVARFAGAGAYHSVSERTIVFGGLQGTATGNDTWAWRTPDPAVSVSPDSAGGSSGGSVLFSADAGGRGRVRYQWMKDGADLPGETGATLFLSGLTLDDAGVYAVRATDLCGEAVSDGATLAVAPCAADFDGDGTAGTIFDLFDFLAALDGGLDFDGDTAPSTIFDLFDFLAALDAGCP